MTELDSLLQEEQNRLAERQKELQEQISSAEKQLHAVSVRLTYVNGLLNSDEVPEADSHANSSPRRHDILDIAEAILGEREGTPMHFKELSEKVQARGGDIPGLDAANTLLSRLVKDERFVRPTRRGFYALRADYPSIESVGARKPNEKSDSGKGEPL